MRMWARLRTPLRRNGKAAATTTTPAELERQSLVDDAFRNRADVRSYGSVTSRPAPNSKSVDQTGTTWYVSVFLVVNAALGAGLLNFPHAFHAAGGVASALTVQSMLLVVACSTLIILAYCADAHNSPTYQDVIHSCLGDRFHLLCSAIISGYCFGSCITFLIIIGDQWDQFFYSSNPLFCRVFYTNRPFTVSVTSILFILPLCYPRRIDFLKYVSAAGVATIVYVVALSAWKYWSGEYAGRAGELKTAPTAWSDVFLVAPTIFFGYQCHISSVPIYHCLRSRSTTNFLKTALSALGICMASYSVVAVYGYWTFGGDVSDDILENYNPDDPFVLSAMIAIAAKTYTTYPLLLFCGRTGVDSLWIRFRGLSDSEAELGECRRRLVIASLWFFSSVVAAIFIPGIDIVISFLGAFAAIFIVIFPGLCLVKVASDKLFDVPSVSIEETDEFLTPTVLAPQSPIPLILGSGLLTPPVTPNFTSSFTTPTGSSPVLTPPLSPPLSPPPVSGGGISNRVFLKALVVFGVFLVVLGVFFFGIIFAQSCTRRISKQPLCVS